MRVSVVQMSPGAAKADNITQARRLIEDAVAADRPDMVSLPEMWTCLGGDRATKMAEAEALPAAGSNMPGGAAYEFLREVARTRGVHVHGGSLGEAADGKLYNTTVVFGRAGMSWRGIGRSICSTSRRRTARGIGKAACMGLGRSW